MKKLLNLGVVAAILATTMTTASAEFTGEGYVSDDYIAADSTTAEVDLTKYSGEEATIDSISTKVDPSGYDETATVDDVYEDVNTAPVEASEADITSSEEVTGETSAVADSKGTPDTGVGGIAATAGVAVIAVGALTLCGKKRN